MSHVDSNIVPSIISDIEAEYGKFAKMTITWGKIQKFLGMTTNYYLPVKLILYMVYCIGNMIDEI